MMGLGRERRLNCRLYVDRQADATVVEKLDRLLVEKHFLNQTELIKHGIELVYQEVYEREDARDKSDISNVDLRKLAEAIAGELKPGLRLLLEGTEARLLEKISNENMHPKLLKLESDTKKAGKNRSEYLRELVKNSKGVDTTFVADRSTFIRQITGIATNVNQIAKVVNTQGFAYSGDINGIKRDLEDIKRLMQEVLVTWQSLRYCI